MNWLRSILRWITNLFHRNRITITHGVYVFCGWANPREEFGLVPGIQCPTDYPWDFKVADRAPALGYYDERDPIITAQRLQWMREAAIDHAVYQIEWRHDTHQLLWSHCADNQTLVTPVKFSLSFFDVLANGTSDSYLGTLTPEEIEASIRAFARAIAPYTTRPNYLRVDSRPVFFRGYPDNLLFYGRFGISPARYLAILREEIGPLYIVATAVRPETVPDLKAWGYDAYTEYLLYPVEWESAQATYDLYWSNGIKACEATGIEYWVAATAGFNGAAWGIWAPPFMPTPKQFTEHLKKARAFSRDHSEHTRGQVICYAWNEFAEGGILEPMKPGMIRSGDEMLRAHLAAISGD